MATDWLSMINESGEQAKFIAAELPTLSEKGITTEQASRFYKVVERGAQSHDELIEAMEAQDADDELVEVAETLQDLWSTLSVAAANILRELQGLPKFELPDDIA